MSVPPEGTIDRRMPTLSNNNIFNRVTHGRLPAPWRFEGWFQTPVVYVGLGLKSGAENAEVRKLARPAPGE
jgi:hypothetical protein